MNKPVIPGRFLYTALFAAIGYCVFSVLYIRRVSFSQSYLLYVGNLVFAIVIGIYLGWLYKTVQPRLSVIGLIKAGHFAAAGGIVAACLLSFILLFLFQPAAFRHAGAQLHNAPSQLSGSHRGFALVLFADAVLGNAAASFFVSMLLPFSIVRNQGTGEVKP